MSDTPHEATASLLAGIDQLNRHYTKSLARLLDALRLDAIFLPGDAETRRKAYDRDLLALMDQYQADLHGLPAELDAACVAEQRRIPLTTTLPFPVLQRLVLYRYIAATRAIAQRREKIIS